MSGSDVEFARKIPVTKRRARYAIISSIQLVLCILRGSSVAKTQQDVSIYNEKFFSTAQSQFEKDLKKRQREGWRLISVTPTKKEVLGVSFN